eukprot:TRINITY_DN699_c0_g1_i2.p1 TRINITY_DN699_c0_g1~~TRINITY_DN699_c0_g1_i2.p1  ORF type:complete len:228 (+),score=17.35 TRINITY_DN699_c0_g1_i2:32-685(+)
MSKRKRLEPPDIRRRKKARVAVSSLEVMMSLGFDRNGRMTEAQADFTGTRDSGDDEPRTPTHSAILSLRSYLVDLNVDVLQLPFVFFQSQIYYFIPDRTTVDVELNALKAAGTMRVFKMISTTNEHSIMLTTDYLDLIEQQSLFFLKQHPHLRIFGSPSHIVILYPLVYILYTQPQAQTLALHWYRHRHRYGHRHTHIRSPRPTYFSFLHFMPFCFD